MNKILIVVLGILAAVSAHAQSGWHILPNEGYASEKLRSEDIFFTNPTTGFCVTLDNNIFKTTDGGAHWIKKNDNADSIRFRSIEFSTDGQYGIAGSLTGAIFKSADYGETWQRYTGTWPGIFEKNFCGLDYENGIFYGVGWWGGDTPLLHKSSDNGETWSHTELPFWGGLVDVKFLNDSVGFVTGRKRTLLEWGETLQFPVIYKTQNGGATWSQVFLDSSIGHLAWKIQFLNPLLGYVSLQPKYGSEGVDILKTTDGGNSWQMIHVGEVPADSLNSSGATQGTGFATPLHGWVGGYYNGLFETFDGGSTWNKLDFGANFNRFFVMDTNLVYAGGQLPYRYGPAPPPAGISIIARQKPAAPHTLHNVTPNPATGLLTIAFDLHNETNVVLEVASIDTRTTYPIARGRMKRGHYEYKWDSSNVPAGNYFVWLGTDEIPLARKFTVVR